MRRVIPLVAIATICLAAGRAAADDPVCGDVNASGTVSASDALLVLQKGVQQPVELDCSPFDTALQECLQYATPIVVAVGDGNAGSQGFVSRSTNGGTTWVDAAVQPSTTNKLEAVASNGRAVVAVDNFAFQDFDTVLIHRSIDGGNTWATATTQPVGSNGLRDIVSNGSRFVAVGVTGTAFYSDDDGDSWTAATTPPAGDSNVFGVAAAGARFVAVSATKAWVSEDGGDNWAQASQHPPGAAQLTRVAANDTAFVAVGRIESTGAVFRSLDGGETWNAATTQPVAPGFLIDSVATDGSRFIIGSYNGKVYYSDDDGDTWTVAATNPVSTIAINAVSFIDHRAVAVDLGGKAHWSQDRGVHWYEAYQQSAGIAGYYGITR